MTKWLLTPGLTLALAAISVGLAAAQPSLTPPTPEPPAMAGIDRGVLEDAHSDRVWLSPTALFAPAGTWSLHDLELFFVGVSYSPTSTMSLSLTTMVPFAEEIPLVLIATGRGQVARVGPLRVALHGLLAHLDGDAGFPLAAAGGVVTYCLDPDCHSYLNGSVGAGASLSSRGTQVYALHAGWVHRMASWAKLVLALDSYGAYGDGVAIGWYGLRFTSRNLALDAGLGKLLCRSCDGGELRFGVPWASVTLRGI